MDRVKIKRIVSLFLIFPVLFIFSACGKSDNAKLADSLIVEIGAINRNSEQSIIRAENVVARLSDDEKMSLDNLDIFEQARYEYDMMFAQ